MQEGDYYKSQDMVIFGEEGRIDVIDVKQMETVVKFYFLT